MRTKKPIVFIGAFLSISGNKTSLETFQQCLSENTYSFSENGMEKRCQVGYVKNLATFSFYEDAESEPFFGAIDFDTQLVWWSDFTKKTTLLMFLQSKFEKKQFAIGNIYREDQFVQALERLDQIRVVYIIDPTEAVRELSGDAEITPIPPQTLVSDRIFEKKLDKAETMEKIKDALSDKLHREIQIIGRDEKNRSMLYNGDGFFRRIEIKEVNTDGKGNYVQEEVFEKLFKKLEKESFL